MALTKWTDFVASNPLVAREMRPKVLVCKGMSDDDLYLTQGNIASSTWITQPTGGGSAATKYEDFVSANRSIALQLEPVLLVAKGNTNNNFYVLELDTTTGAVITS